MSLCKETRKWLKKQAPQHTWEMNNLILNHGITDGWGDTPLVVKIIMLLVRHTNHSPSSELLGCCSLNHGRASHRAVYVQQHPPGTTGWAAHCCWDSTAAEQGFAHHTSRGHQVHKAAGRCAAHPSALVTLISSFQDHQLSLFHACSTVMPTEVYPGQWILHRSPHAHHCEKAETGLKAAVSPSFANYPSSYSMHMKQ